MSRLVVFQQTGSIPGDIMALISESFDESAVVQRQDMDCVEILSPGILPRLNGINVALVSLHHDGLLQREQ